NQDFRLNSAANPAAKGSVVMIYGTGEGKTDPPGTAGLASEGTLQHPVAPVSVLIGGQPAEVLYAGSAPGLVMGLLQGNARVPELSEGGSAVPVVLTIGRANSHPSATLAVQ